MLSANISRTLRSAAAVLALAALGACAAQPGGLARTGARVGLARVALQSGNPSAALRLADKALARHPGDPAALLLRGEALSRLGQPGPARAAFAQVLGERPDSVPALVGLGRLRLVDAPDRAAVLFRHALAEAPGNTAALTDLGVALDLQGDHAAAQASYRLALAANPTLVPARVNLALSLAESGQGPAAVAMMAPMAGNAAAGPKLREDYAAILTMAGQSNRARAVLAGVMPPAEAAAALAAYAAGPGR
ncbi:MAG: tetratricopeptide repeat protein [Acetobacteraceae bacterium]